MADRRVFGGALLALVLPSPAAWAQAIPKDEYLRYVPLEYRKVVSQTEASTALRV